jgi:hypothetical protein
LVSLSLHDAVAWSALAAGRYVETAAGWGCGFALAVQTGGSSTAMLDDNES